ncbi:hypothetical protein [Nocardioides panaciterrulae]|uniref:Endonuclease/exonuclease/phosphatase family metal-dependent hydrolase n=1 Tax=Nocardioides panaciterrulae TaxID=661492 RepID=A0A7Y9EA58_9ACTN|nr:hypothetical protein [Nocardioides panaciterrulae]NYD43923.1 endonuclease/exonuclease/phosphatase family metal-dependent hydrolase [Nocardioides panaciterrulae]NYD43992.1 endonuclease/exonuclease/phosphatase family metal-dependent hydrolase [Nocardioides panaciterrulae]
MTRPGRRGTFRLAHTNIESPDPARLNAETITDALARGDVVTFNEAKEKTSHEVLRSAEGFSCHIAGENAISWLVERFREKAVGRHVVMRGGHVGAGLRRTDRRRVGPSRELAWALLEDLHTDGLLIAATHHAVAKADTTAKWRRRRRARGFHAVAKELRRILAQHPGAALALTGDMNTIGRIVFRVHGLREVKTPATYGRRRYDRLFVLRCKARHVRAFRTHADHLGLSADITPEEN